MKEIYMMGVLIMSGYALTVVGDEKDDTIAILTAIFAGIFWPGIILWGLWKKYGS